jgi:hypothetical protein
VAPKKINVQHSDVFLGIEGASFNHQPQLTSFNGLLYASWTMGIQDEESPGEKVVFATSDDRGCTWSQPRTIATPDQSQFADRVLVNSGIRAYDGILIAYYGDWEYSADALDADGRLKNAETGHSAFYDNIQRAGRQRRPYANCIGHLDCVTRAKTSRDGGRTWSEPIDIVPRLASYHVPKATTSGRLILPGHVTFPYTDDPAGLSQWRYAGLAGLPPDFVDDVMGWFFGREARNDPVIYSEGSFFQTADGVLHMMLRTEVDWLAVSESIDDGKTWGEPLQTDYTDNVARPFFGQLPDGRYFGMTTPSPDGRRTPAILALSNDGVAFDRHFILGDDSWRPMRFPGLNKGGRYGYPWLHIDGEFGYMVYSVEKEDIGIGRFRLEDLR